jgi:hypothetical protein
MANLFEAFSSRVSQRVPASSVSQIAAMQQAAGLSLAEMRAWMGVDQAEPVRKKLATPVVLAPEKVEAPVVDEMAQEYRALATELGIETGPIDAETEDAKFKAFLSQEAILVYPMKQVSDFLSQHVPDGKVWGWWPLLKRHTSPQFEAGADGVWRASLAAMDVRFVRGNGAVNRAEPYSKPVPYAALCTVKKILAQFPNAEFYVSDYAEKRPDPFLAVRLRSGAELMVIEHWDEPTFGLKKNA